MSEERIKPLGHVFGDGYVRTTDNTSDYSGAVVHPLESDDGRGTYMAPLTINDPKAMATRIHEYAHLNLITSGEQPLGLGEAFETAGIGNEFLQAMADAKVMSHCMKKKIDISDLVVLSDTGEFAVQKVQAASKIKQANLYLRSIGTKLHEFVDKTVTLPDKKKVYIKDVFLKLADIRTLEEWVRLGLEYQKAFETPKLKSEREAKAKKLEEEIPAEPKEEDEGEGTLEEGLESKESRPKPKRETEKEAREKFKDIAKKVSEKVKPKPAEKAEEEEAATEKYKPKLSKGETAKLGGSAASEEKEKEAKLDVLEEKEEKEKTEDEKIIQEIEEFAEDLDSMVEPKAFKKEHLEKIMKDHNVEPGAMKIVRPPLEKNFEPKEKAKRAKRSYVGAFRYPHRLVSDSAVFASKLRGKGGTLIIDCSGSMGITYADVQKVLEQRPFATIAIYAGDNKWGETGSLIILVDRGKCIKERLLRETMGMHFGNGNVVDIPALQWLSKRAGEKFWICDGGVTGTRDRGSYRLKLIAALIERRYNIKRWYSIENFLAGERPASDHV